MTLEIQIGRVEVHQFNFVSNFQELELQFTKFADEAELHSHIWKSLLRSAMAYGTQTQIAENAAISEVYLSNLLQPDHPPPSLEVETRLAKVLPFDRERREDWLNHLALSRQKQSALGKSIRDGLTIRDAGALAAALQAHHHSTMYSNSTVETETAYRAVQRSGQALIQGMRISMSPIRYARDYAQVFLVMHDADSVLNRHGDALFFAEQVSAILSEVDERAYRRHRETIDYLRVNAFYAASVTYNNLGLSQEALLSCMRAESALGGRAELSAVWLPHILRDRIKAVSGQPRFKLRDITALFHRAQAQLNTTYSPLNDLFSIMLERSFADALIEYAVKRNSPRSLVEAEQIIQRNLDRLNQSSAAGALHRVSFLRTCARLRRIQNSDEWLDYVKEALVVAFGAGLTHQISQIQRDFRVLRE